MSYLYFDKVSLLAATIAIAAGVSVASAETLRIVAIADATLIEHPTGNLANGKGSAFFVGRTGQKTNSVRRATLRFDVANQLPEGSKIMGAKLELCLTSSNDREADLSLHRLLQPWNEGPAASSGGSGDEALPEDVTWVHTGTNDTAWKKPGGHFVARKSSVLLVGESGKYVWELGPQMLNDVRLWVRVPKQNHGWLIVGDESVERTSKRFQSREVLQEERKPTLVINYELKYKNKN